VNEQERQRIATIGSAFLGKVAQRLQTLQPEELSAADVARWTDVALKLQQAGQPHTGYDREARLESQQLRPLSEEDEPITRSVPRP
jgi:hypothetical protein